jgi:hypothetical protein
LLEACKRKVPEAEMVSHEEVLVGIGRVDEWWRVLSSGERDGCGLVSGLVGDGMGWPARALIATGGGEVGVLSGFMDRDMVAWDAGLEGGVVWMFTNGAGLEDWDANLAVMANGQARPVMVGEEVRQKTVTGDVCVVVAFVGRVLSVPVGHGENAGMESGADKNFVIIDEDFAPMIVGVFVTGLAAVGALSAADAQ